MLAKASMPHKMDALSILNLFPKISDFRKAEKSKALKMLNVFEVGAPTMCQADGGHVRLLLDQFLGYS